MPDRIDRVIFVIMATPESGESCGIPEPVGLSLELRQARRTCRALDLGPTGYCGAHYVPLTYLTLPTIEGMKEGYNLVQQEYEDARQQRLYRDREGRPGYGVNRCE